MTVRQFLLRVIATSALVLTASIVLGQAADWLWIRLYGEIGHPDGLGWGLFLILYFVPSVHALTADAVYSWLDWLPRRALAEAVAGIGSGVVWGMLLVSAWTLISLIQELRGRLRSRSGA